MHQSITLTVLRAMGIPLPQQKFVFRLFSSWLSVRGRFNYTNLHRHGIFHERTLRRGFVKDFNWLDFNRRLLTLMIPPRHPLIAAMDATFIPKSGKCTPGIGWFFNGCASRVEKGLEASVVALVDTTTNTAYALSALQTPVHPASVKAGGKKNQKTAQGAAGESRLNFYLRHLRVVRPYFPASVRHLAVDGFYACRTFVDGVVSLELDVIGKLRHNASLSHLYTGLQKRRGRRRIRGHRVNWKNLDLSLWKDEGEMEKGTRLFSAVVLHNSLKRQIKVALLERKTAQGIARVLLFSTDLKLSGKSIVADYRARFQIEFLFRDAKGSMGLKHCQSRQPKAIDFHWNASLCALNLAKWQERKCGAKQRFSAVSCKQRNSNAQLLEVFSVGLGLDWNAVKCHPAYQTLCNYGVIIP
jgi:hypothetical protein